MEAQCYAIADSDKTTSSDQLISFDPTTGTSFAIGALSTLDVEAATLSLDGGILYAVDGGQLGTVHLLSGLFSARASALGTGSGALGNVTFSDVDSLTFDPLTTILYGVHRTVGDNSPDLLLQIDPATGAHRPDAFGPGLDYVAIAPLGGLESIDDLAIDPVDGQLYGIANDEGTGYGDHLILIDKLTGATTDVGTIGVIDVEGLSFASDGRLLATTGADSTFGQRDSLFELDKATGAATQIAALFPLYTDYEALTCPGPGINTLLGTVFKDQDSDGFFDDPPPVAQPPVLVELYLDVNDNGQVDAGDQLLQTTLTDPNGGYRFVVGSEGSFVITIDRGTLPLATALTTDDLEESDFVGFGQIDPGNDFGYIAPATLGDRVWLDSDGDGIQDIGEPGLPNVEVALFAAGGDGLSGTADDVLLATTLTDSHGNYLFTGLPPGTYFTDVTAATLPPGLVTSPGTSDPSRVVAVASGDVVLDLDFGYSLAPGSGAALGDFVWSDADGDGVQDPGEPGIGGVTLDLISVGADGLFGTADDVLIATTTTDADGTYLFTSIPPGKYLVEVSDRSLVLTAYTPTVGLQSQGGPLSDPLTLTDGDVDLRIDFGYFNPSLATISDTLWLDIDGNGIQDPGEKGIPGVSVLLLDPSGTVIATVLSDADGQFTFSGLPDGDYEIVVEDVFSVLSGNTATTFEAATATLPVSLNGSDLNGINFGYNAPGLIGDTVWSDADADGVQDPGEPGIGGVEVELYRDLNGDGIFDAATDPLIATTITDAAGHYLFSGLGFSTWFVGIDDGQPELSGSTLTTADDEAAAGAQLEVVLTSTGPSFLAADFGYFAPALPDVSGNVFHDLDLDGVDDGSAEPGFEVISLALVAAGPDGLFGTADDLVVASTTTDPNGDYFFSDVPPGTYRVAVTDAQGALIDFFLTSGLDALPVIVAASDVTDIDFGYARDSANASIGDTVWLDANRDGLLGAAESGLTGVTLGLFELGPDGLAGTGDDLQIATTQTDANGRYRFPGLRPGFYYVDVDDATLPLGLSPTTNDPFGPIALSAGESFDLADFGYAPTSGSALGDQVWYDADGDGLQDPDEIGIAGVAIQVSGPSGNFIVITELDGSWLLTGLDPGTYTVSADPATLPAGLDPTPTNGPISLVIPLSTDFDAMHGDFGFNGGTLGSIGDTVWLDADGDRIQDPGETGLGGVTLDLRDGAGNVIATTTTGASGHYDFVGLPSGTYQVVVTDLDGVLVELNPSVGADPAPFVVLAAGQDYDDADFPYHPSRGLGSLGNLVWHDRDADGLRDPDEPGLPSATVDLWLDVDGNGVITPGIDNFLRSTLTDAQGEYLFTGLPATDYLIDVDDGSAVLAGMVKTTGPVPGADDNSQVDPFPASLSAIAPNLFTADFGFYAPANLAISGITFEDVDKDALLDGSDIKERSILLLLFRDLDGDGQVDPEEPVIATTLSAAGGSFFFSNLPPGDYLIVANATGTNLDGFEQTTQTLTAAVQPVTLVDSDSTANDFGFHLRSTRVLLTAVAVHQVDGRIVVAWETAAEEGTLGFDLYRLDGDRGDFLLLNDSLLVAAQGAPQGARYHFVDRDAVSRDPLTYALVEHEAAGLATVHGPWRLELDPRPIALPPDGSFLARARPVTERMQSRLASHALAQRAAINKRPPAAPVGLEIHVEDSGIYRLLSASIAQSLGLQDEEMRALIEHRELALSHRGQAVAWQGLPHSAGIVFYGQALEGDIYSKHNTYLLTLERGQTVPEPRPSQDAPVTESGSFTTTARFEEDLIPVTAVPIAAEQGFWFWKPLLAGHPQLARQSFTLTVDGLAPSRENAVLRMWLQGVSNDPRIHDSDHRTLVRLNGTLIDELVWDGLTRFQAELSFPHDLLVAGDNTVELEAPGSPGIAFDAFYVDRFELTYERLYRAVGDRLSFTANRGRSLTVSGFTNDDILAFDITQPLRPTVPRGLRHEFLEGTFSISFRAQPGKRYVTSTLSACLEPTALVAYAPSRLRHRNNLGEHLILTTAELTAAAERLAEYRRGQGLTSLVVDIADVYREFNHGVPSPWAIRDLLRFAAWRWAVEPHYVLLLGAGHFDYHDHWGRGGQLIPPVLITSPQGLYAADSRLADLDDDGLSDVMLGRLPVLSTDEVDAFLAKLMAYETAPDETWQQRALFLADDSDPRSGDFSRSSERLIASLSGELHPERLYFTGLETDEARQRLLDRWRQGVGWVNFFGHGGLDTLSGRRILTTDHIAELTNGERLPIVTSLSCNIGRFEVPGFASLAGELTLATAGGAIAVFAPSGQSLNNDALRLGQAIFNAAGRHDLQTVGEVLNAALAAYTPTARYRSMGDTYQLFGDPATRLRTGGR